MKHIVLTLVFTLALGGCLARHVVAEREIYLEIQENPCLIEARVDGEVVQTIDGRKHKIKCPIGVIEGGE